jgi:hypothetical protein
LFHLDHIPRESVDVVCPVSPKDSQSMQAYTAQIKPQCRQRRRWNVCASNASRGNCTSPSFRRECMRK